MPPKNRRHNHAQFVMVLPWFAVILPLAVLGVAQVETEEGMWVGVWGRWV